ncbi:MAG: RtcB family protein [Oligoflexia bacterium]|nr:RtcB family protein [Oligoflexia bacterium]
MLEIRGRCAVAKIYADVVEESAMSQIYNMLNCVVFENCKIVIMPDVHTGNGAVVGTVAEFRDRIIPRMLGVDLGCGMTSYNLGALKKFNLEHLDEFIRRNIPLGSAIHKKALDDTNEFEALAKKTKQKYDNVLNSLGTLGGGNHFIELGKDSDDSYWLTIHSGSRNFGFKVAMYYIDLAYKESHGSAGSFNGMEFLNGDQLLEYINAVEVAVRYASLNRELIGKIIINNFFKMRYHKLPVINAPHNYIQKDIIHKGSISAKVDELVVIPWNMRDGLIIAKGKGNAEWLESAPHGAGRIMSRKDAKESIPMHDFRQSMEGIFTTSVSANTVDESPMAYKNPTIIQELIKDTVEVISVVKPIYNVKAGENI